MNNTASVEGILYSNYIKYDKLLGLVSSSNLSKSSSDKINIFIDINSMVLPLFRYQNIRFNDYNCLCSIVINMCAHYRNYFRQKHKVESDIYLVYSRNYPESCRSFVANYNIKTSISIENRKDITKFIEDNITILNTICPFIPNVYILRDDTTESSVIVRSIYTHLQDFRIPNLIISKDPYMYTLASVAEATIFRPSKTNGEDTSFYVDNITIWDAYRSSLNIKREYTPSISSELFPFVLALSSASFRGLRSILNFNKAIKLVEQGVTNRIILDKYIEDAEFATNSLSILYSSMGINEINAHDVACRYKSINAIYQSVIYKMSPNYALIPSSIKIDLFDPEAIKKISEEFFANNPLDLNKL